MTIARRGGCRQINHQGPDEPGLSKHWNVRAEIGLPPGPRKTALRGGSPLDAGRGPQAMVRISRGPLPGSPHSRAPSAYSLCPTGEEAGTFGPWTPRERRLWRLIRACFLAMSRTSQDLADWRSREAASPPRSKHTVSAHLRGWREPCESIWDCRYVSRNKTGEGSGGA